MEKLRKVCIVGGLRIPFCRSGTFYQDLDNKAMMSFVLKAMVDKYSLKNEELGDVAIGAVLKHVRDFNLSRECVLESGLSPNTPAYDIQRACGTSLEGAIQIAHKIAVGAIDSGIAGGCDTNSDVPIEFSDQLAKRFVNTVRAKTLKDRMKAWKGLSVKELKPSSPSIQEPRTGLSMGESCEVMAKKWNITREAQDELALRSHHNAAKAMKENFFHDLVVPFNGATVDNNVRGDTSLEKLAKLKPVFDFSGAGTLTAGNSSTLSDGAAAVLLCSEEWAKARGLKVLAYLTFTQSAAVDFVRDEGLLMAPAYAVPKLLKRANLTLQDFDFYEIHEAFAAQVLCTLKAWESKEFCTNKLKLEKELGSLDFNKYNLKGGSVAIGHPFAATGARILASLAKMIDQKGQGRGLISVCTAGGMGVTAIVEK